MRVSIPGVPGVYFDTEGESTAINVALTAVGRRAPKPQGYAVQLLPYLWSFDVDLREVPNDHPIQYLHPEGAQSLGELSPERSVRQAGTELESVLRFVWSVNQEVETAATRLVGAESEEEGVVIEINDGRVGVDGQELETDEFDIDGAAETDATELGFDEGADTDADEFDDEDTSGPSDVDDSSDDGFDTGNEL